jgi:predicted amidohydrolase
MNLLSGLLLSLGLIDGTNLVIGVLRVMPERWDKEANLQKLDKYARIVVAKGAQLVVTPEGFLDGYVGNDAVRMRLSRNSLRGAPGVHCWKPD